MATGSQIALALAALCFEGCAIYGAELTSMPTLGPEFPRVHDCERTPKLSYYPPSGAQLCLSMRGVEMQVEAHNAEVVVGAFGPMPLIPLFGREPSTQPLRIDIGLFPGRRYSFSPWRVQVRTDQGETIRVKGVRQNVREGNRVRTVSIDPDDAEAGMIDEHQGRRFFLTFEKHVAPEQGFALTVRLSAPDGADIVLPIRFQKGKVLFLASIP